MKDLIKSLPVLEAARKKLDGENIYHNFSIDCSDEFLSLIKGKTYFIRTYTLFKTIDKI